jgi:4-amino-4-deoxy-L-arabinose transferase-like glycosyltransferase
VPLWSAVAAVALTTLIGAGIRLAGSRDLSVNEVLNVNQAQLPFGRLISHVVHHGVQPPLHPILEWLAIRVLGDSTFAVRLPSLAAGVALIPAIAWLAAVLFDRRTAVVAAVFASVGPILVWYSQEASGYALVALFGTLSLVGVARASRRSRPQDWALHVVAASAAVWSDWSAIFIVLAAEFPLAAGLLARRRNGTPLRGYVTAWALDTLALACQLVPLALLFASQVRGHGGLAGVLDVSASSVSFYSAVSNVSWALFGFHPAVVTAALSAVWPLAMLASLLMVGRGVQRRPTLLLVCALLPAVGILLLGLFARGSFDIRYFLAAVPPVILLLARMTTGWPRSRTGMLIVAAGITVLLTAALVDQQRNPNNPRRYDYARAIASVQSEAGRSAAVYLAPGNLEAVVARQAPGLRTAPLSPRLATRAQAANVFVVKSFSNRPDLQHLVDRDIGALRATRHLVRRRRYPGVIVWWFR